MYPPSSSSFRYADVITDGSQYLEPRSPASSSSSTSSSSSAADSAAASELVAARDGRGKVGAAVAGVVGAEEEVETPPVATVAAGEVIDAPAGTAAAAGTDPDPAGVEEAAASAAVAAASC
jgi:hypothetical protein